MHVIAEIFQKQMQHSYTCASNIIGNTTIVTNLNIMLSKQQVSFVRSLHQKKFRQMYGKFLVEGDKLVRELLQSTFKVDAIFKLKGWEFSFKGEKPDVFEVSEDELRKIATHESPNQVLAVALIPKYNATMPAAKLEDGLYVACDNLNDPGNAGAIIRTADWFGVKKVFFSEDSVDVYNPKVVNAAKGSLFRLECNSAKLESLFEANKHIKVYGAFMQGESIYKTELDKNAFIVIGNEANGISSDLLPFIHHRITIPSFGGAESLNAAVAAGILMSEWKAKER